MPVPSDATRSAVSQVLHRAGRAIPAGVVLLAAACGAQAPKGETPPSVDDDPGTLVTAGSLAFRPGSIEIVAGQSTPIALQATDIAHDITIDDTGFHLHADGGTTEKAAMQIDTPGTYTAYCSVTGHRAAGMEMVVKVSAEGRP